MRGESIPSRGFLQPQPRPSASARLPARLSLVDHESPVSFCGRQTNRDASDKFAATDRRDEGRNRESCRVVSCIKKLWEK